MINVEYDDICTQFHVICECRIDTCECHNNKLRQSLLARQLHVMSVFVATACAIVIINCYARRIVVVKNVFVANLFLCPSILLTAVEHVARTPKNAHCF